MLVRVEEKRVSVLLSDRENREREREREAGREGMGQATLRGHPHPRLEKVFLRVLEFGPKKRQQQQKMQP